MALQNRVGDWDLGSKACYDAESLSRLQDALRQDMKKFAREFMTSCLTCAIDPSFAAVLEDEILKCRPDDLGKLMADHTQVIGRCVLQISAQKYTAKQGPALC